LLLSLGLSKSRGSELNKISTAPDAVWNKYSTGQLGYKATFQLMTSSAGGTAAAQGEGEEEGEADEKPTKKRNVAKIHPLPKPIQKALAAAVEPWLAKNSRLPQPMKSDARTEYGFTYEANGKTLYFTIFADKAD